MFWFKLTARSRVACALLAFAGAGWFFARHAPDASSIYPPCAVHALSGLHCPGCGTARAVHALANADFGAAFHYNALATLVLCGLLPWSAWQVWLGLNQNRFAAVSVPAVASWSIVWIVATFTIARNLPWAPFSWLAPGG
jgi:hypothetical protein